MKKIIILLLVCLSSCNSNDINIVGHKKHKNKSTIMYIIKAPIRAEISYINSDGKEIFETITDSLGFNKTVIFNKNITYSLTLMTRTNFADTIQMSIINSAKKTSNELNVRASNDLIVKLSENFSTFR